MPTFLSKNARVKNDINDTKKFEEIVIILNQWFV